MAGKFINLKEPHKWVIGPAVLDTINIPENFELNPPDGVGEDVIICPTPDEIVVLDVS